MSLYSVATAFSSNEMLRDLYASRNSNSAASGVAAGSQSNETDEVNTSSVSRKTKYSSDDVLDISDKGKAIPESSGVYSSRPSGVTEPSGVAELSKADKDESIKSDSSNSAEMKNARVGGGGQLSKPSAPPPEESESESESEDVEESSGSSISVSKELTAEEEEEVRELKELDAEVRQRKADKSGGDQYIQNDADYIFQTGPDGNRYAIAEAVSVNVSETGDNSEAATEETQQTAATLTAPTEQPESGSEVAAAAKGSVEAKAEAEDVNAQNSKYGIFRNENTILKSFAASAYSNQSTLSGNRTSINRVNVFA